MRIVIVGGGDIGRELASTLRRHKDSQVVIVEADEARAKELSESLDALVLHGDGTHPEMLQKAEVAESDALVATTGSDALNAVIAMLGQQMGVEKIVVKLNEVGLRAACRKLGVTDIIAPKIAAAAQIMSVLHGFHRLDFSVVARGGIQMSELGSGRAAGQRLSKIDVPDGCLIVAILRGDEVLMAKGELKVEKEDSLLVMVESDEVLEELKTRIEPEGGG